MERENVGKAFDRESAGRGDLVWRDGFRGENPLANPSAGGGEIPRRRPLEKCRRVDQTA